LYEQSITGENWELALELGLKLLTGYRRLYPVYDVNVALMLMKIGKLAWLVPFYRAKAGKSLL
jgi:hypothetical protein